MNHKQKRFLDELQKKLLELDDPDPEIITYESYSYSLRYVARHCTWLPKITFTPYGKDTKIKAEIMRKASLGTNAARERELMKLREKYGFNKGREAEDRILARKFNAYWDRYWSRKAKALDELEDPQKRFVKGDDTIAEPIRLIMEHKIPLLRTEWPETHENVDIKPYSEELLELE
jgi:hypothetical protein